MKAKPGQLKMQWGRVDRHSDPDVCYVWGGGVDKCDSRLLHYILSCRLPNGWGGYEESFTDQLKSRGYDITTIRFSIQKARPAQEKGGV